MKLKSSENSIIDVLGIFFTLLSIFNANAVLMQ